MQLYSSIFQVYYRYNTPILPYISGIFTGILQQFYRIFSGIIIAQLTSIESRPHDDSRLPHVVLQGHGCMTLSLRHLDAARDVFSVVSE